MSLIPHTVYLLHFHPAFGHARHYVGITQSRRLGARFAEHQAGNGAALTAAAIAAGCELHVARLWPNATFWFESQIKKASHLDRLCPICSVDLDVPIETRFAPLVASPRKRTGSSDQFAPIGWPEPLTGDATPKRRGKRTGGSGKAQK